ncbi:MAG: ABC transporter ATP-binding protein [Oscillospiraceae bacterium]|nr:ABC transporter ATP-binding protein [Oscillospiraceae bacterium]
MFQIKWVWQNLTGYKRRYIMALSFTVISSVLVFIRPLLTQIVVDDVLVGVTLPDGTVFRNYDILIPLLLGMVGIHLFRMCMLNAGVYNCDYASQGMLINMREHLYSRLQAQDKTYYDRNRTGDLMTRLTGDLDTVRNAVSFVFREFTIDIFLFVTTAVYFFTINALFTLAVLAVTPLLLVLSKIFSKRVRSKYVFLREKLSEMNTKAQEDISGNRVIKAFARERYEIDEFSKKNDAYRRANIDAQFTWLRYFPAVHVLANTLTITILLVGGLFIINGWMSAGDLAAFMALDWAISEPMRNIGLLLNDLQRFFASADKVIEMYYQQPRIVDSPDAVEIPGRMRGKVEFKDVSFRFGEKTVFDGISFVVNPGETVAVMGSTGSGKTSLVNLIERFYDVSGGAIYVDGIDVRKLKLQSLRGGIGMATQDVFLFSETVDGNIAYGDPEMPEEEVRRFAQITASDFIDGMEDGFETIVGERGVGLSGGQKQRIALARALAIRPAILILDDTTSAVDMETEKYIQKQLRELDFSCTKFIIAQRISSVKQADKIIILDGGKIVESGTHEELLGQNGYYREIYELQHGTGKAGEIDGAE